MKALATGILMIALVALVSGQSTTPPRFEIASIKPAGAPPLNSPNDGRGVVRVFPGGRLTAEGAVLRFIIQNAYRMRPFQIIGGPDWINSTHYTIEAKADGNVPPQQLWLMLQSLLEDRFQLKARRETRQLPVYELTVAKGGFKLPPPKDGGCFTIDPANPLPPPPAPGQPMMAPCGSVMGSGGPSGMRIIGARIPMSELARILTNMLDRSVIDKTGFSGTFDVNVEFSFDQALAGLGENPTTGRVFAKDPTTPSIFTALQEQLGLKLESAKGPVDVIVIDSIEKPVGN